MAREPIAKKIDSGRQQKKLENEANPEMHATKNSMRRKGFSEGKIFSGALRQAERYNARRSSSDGSMAKPNQLLQSHLKQIHTKGATAYNIGHYVDDNTIGSKTDQGYLSSTKNGRGVSHTWTDPNAEDKVL